LDKFAKQGMRFSDVWRILLLADARNDPNRIIRGQNQGDDTQTAVLKTHSFVQN